MLLPTVYVQRSACSLAKLANNMVSRPKSASVLNGMKVKATQGQKPPKSEHYIRNVSYEGQTEDIKPLSNINPLPYKNMSLCTATSSRCVNQILQGSATDKLPPPPIPSEYTVYDYQRYAISVARQVLKSPLLKADENLQATLDLDDKTLASLVKQIGQLKSTSDRSMTKQQWQAALCLQDDLVQLIAKRLRQQDSTLSQQQADSKASKAYKLTRTDLLNNSPWKIIETTFEHEGIKYKSTQQPAAEMKLGQQNIFEEAFDILPALKGEDSYSVQTTA